MRVATRTGCAETGRSSQSTRQGLDTPLQPATDCLAAGLDPFSLVAASTVAAAAAAAAGAAAASTFVRFVDAECATAKVLAVECLHCLFGSARLLHFDERESARAPSLSIRDHIDRLDRSMLCKQVT